jgi:hypothetical protein
VQSVVVFVHAKVVLIDYPQSGDLDAESVDAQDSALPLGSSKNRAVRSTPGKATQAASTLEESPYHSAGALSFLRPFGSKPAELERPTFGRLPVAFQSASRSHQLSAGPSDTAVIERRRSFLRPFGSKPAELERPTFRRLPVAFQRPLHVIADNHLFLFPLVGTLH